MKSRVYRGQTTHERLEPVRHGFRYRIYWLGIDLDELEQLDRAVRGFGYDRWSLASIRDRDHGGPGGGRIKDRILALLDKHGIDGSELRITLMTIPRIVGYVFNPVNFYVCCNGDGVLEAVVAEVRNTFGEMHHYVSSPEPGLSDDGSSRFTFQKQFYVSPFLDNEGVYRVRVRCEEDHFSASIALEQGGRMVFTADMSGRGMPLSTRSLLGTMARMPWAATSIMTRIQWQAILLRLRRKVRTRPKPKPSNPATIPAARSSVWYWIRSRFVRYAAKPERGQPGDGATEDDRPS
ncbi:MAG: DUF1365 domain-containing protein [Phycisphaerales bacterium]|nr:DUF1365 domain-containing protein [Phycisphaerales bacterium]